MTTYDEARSRLLAWIRDYGNEKHPVFISDVQVVLNECELVRSANERLQAENDRLTGNGDTEAWADELLAQIH